MRRAPQLALAFAVLLGGCLAHRTPAWEQTADPAKLIETAGAELRAGRRTEGAPGLALLERAVSSAERALFTRNRLFREKVRRHERASWLFEGAEQADLPALVIYADALFAWADRQGVLTLLEEQDRIRAAARRAFTLDRTFAYATPDRVIAMLACTLPIGSGANFLQALEHFEAAIASAPGYLPTRVEYALRYAVALRDHALYRRLVQEVLDAPIAPPGAPPELIEENRAAQAKARLLPAAPY